MPVANALTTCLRGKAFSQVEIDRITRMAEKAGEDGLTPIKAAMASVESILDVHRQNIASIRSVMGESFLAPALPAPTPVSNEQTRQAEPAKPEDVRAPDQPASSQPAEGPSVAQLAPVGKQPVAIPEEVLVASTELSPLPDAKPEVAIPVSAIVYSDGNPTDIDRAYDLTGRNKTDMRAAIIIEDVQTGEVHSRGIYKDATGRRMVEFSRARKDGGGAGERTVSLGANGTEGGPLANVLSEKTRAGGVVTPRYRVVGFAPSGAVKNSFALNFKNRGEFDAHPDVQRLVKEGLQNPVLPKRSRTDERAKTVPLKETGKAQKHELTDSPQKIVADLAEHIEAMGEAEARKQLIEKITAYNKANGSNLNAKTFAEELILRARELKERGGMLNENFTIRRNAQWSITPQQALAMIRNAVIGIRKQGGDIALFQKNAASELAAIKQGYGLQMTDEEGRSLIALGLDTAEDLNGESVIKLYHEAAHQLIKKLPEAEQAAYHNAISQLPSSEQRWLLNPFSTDLRLIANAKPENLSAPQRAILAKLTPEEITKLRSIDPTTLLVEQGAEHLAMLGVEKAGARDILTQVIRLAKEVAYRAAMAIRAAFGLRPNERLVRAYVENNYLRFINADFNASQFRQSMRVALGLPANYTDRVTVYSSPETDNPDVMHIDLATGAVLPPGFVAEDQQGIRDRVRAMIVAAENNAILANEGDRPSLTMRAALTPDLDANAQIAERNAIDGALEALYNDPEIRMSVGPNTPFSEFLSDHLGIAESKQPQAMRKTLVEELDKAIDPITGNKVSYNPSAQINTLPSAEDGALGSGQQQALYNTLLYIGKVATRAQDNLAADQQLFDQLDSREKETKRGLNDAERRAKSDLATRIPVMRKIVAKLAENTGRLQEKLRGTLEISIMPGGTYRAPDNDSAAPSQWKEHRIPLDLKFHPDAAAALSKHSANLVDWARNPENAKYGAYVDHASRAAVKLQQIPVNQLEYAANTFRFLKTDSRGQADQFGRMGTPASQVARGKIYEVQNFITGRRDDAVIRGNKWAHAYQELRRALGRQDQPEDLFQAEVYDRMLHVIQRIDDGSPDVIGRSIDALNKIYGLKIDTPKKRAAFSNLFFEQQAASKQANQWFKDASLSVADKDFDVANQGAERGLIRRGAGTYMRGFSKSLAAIEQAMRPQWVNFNDDIDALMADSSGLSKYFTPVVIRDMVVPYVNNLHQVFDVDTGSGARKAQLYNVREAWKQGGGTIDGFAAALHVLEGGDSRNTAPTLKAVLMNMGNIYGKVKAVVAEDDAVGEVGSNTTPRSMMDARKGDDFPPEHLSYRLMDASSNGALLHDFAINKAFGRNGLTAGGSFHELVVKIKHELQELQARALALHQAGMDAKASKKEMGEDKYNIALQANDHIANLDGLIKRMVEASQGKGVNFGDQRVVVEALNLMANQILQQPRSSLIQSVTDPLSALYTMKLGRTSAKAVANSYKETVAELVNSISGVRMSTDMAKRMHDAGIKNPAAFLTIDEALANLGPGNTQASTDLPQRPFTRFTNAVSRTLRNTRTRLQYGPIDNIVQAFSKTSDRDMADIRKIDPNSPKGIRFSPFTIFNVAANASVNSNVKSYVRTIEDFILRGFEQIANAKANMDPKAFDKYLAALESGAAKFDQESMGYGRITKGIGDEHAWDTIRDDISVKMQEGTPERLIIQKWKQTGGKTEGVDLLTPAQFAAVANIANTHLSLQSNASNTPHMMLTNPWVRALSNFLVWPYLATMRALGSGRTASGKITPAAMVDGAAAVMIAALPATVAASLVVDLYDEYLLGKKSNLRRVGAAGAIPGVGLFTEDPMALLERFSRFGGLGFIGDVANQAFNTDDARNGGLSVDNRVLAISAARNFLDTVSRFKNQDFQATYATVYRPLMSMVGMNSVLQYSQLTSRALGLSNAETEVNNRISVGNYLRAEGRALGMNVRTASQTGAAPTPITPWIGEMEYAALTNDYGRFREVYRFAVKAAIDAGKEDPVQYVREAFSSRHPLRRIFRTSPSETEYRRILAGLDDTGRDAVSSAVNNYNRFAERLRLKPFNGVSDDRRPTARAVSISDAHLAAARAALSDL